MNNESAINSSCKELDRQKSFIALMKTKVGEVNKLHSSDTTMIKELKSELTKTRECLTNEIGNI